MKRTTAPALLAAIAILTTSACGTIDEEPAAAVREAIATEGADEMSAENSSEKTTNSVDEISSETSAETAANSADNKSPEISGEAAPATEFQPGSLVNDDNCIIINDSDLTFDKEKLHKMAELAARQFNAVLDDDKQAYFDTVNIPSLLKNQNLIEASTSGDLSDAEENLFYLAVLSTDNTIYGDYARLLEQKPAGMDDETYFAKLHEAIAGAADKVTMENTSSLFEEPELPFAQLRKKYQKFCNEEAYGTPDELRLTPRDGAVYCLDLAEYTANDNSCFATFDLTIYRGKRKYELCDCAAVSEYGDSAAVLEFYLKENDHDGMTAEEIRRDSEDLARLDKMNAAAKVAYNAVAVTVTDAECRGVKLEEYFNSGGFRQAESDTGLDIGRSAGYSDGDGELAKDLRDCGFTDGYVLVRRTEIDGEQTFFVQFRMENGGYIGQYPTQITPERADRAEWGTYLP